MKRRQLWEAGYDVEYLLVIKMIRSVSRNLRLNRAHLEHMLTHIKFIVNNVLILHRDTQGDKVLTNQNCVYVVLVYITKAHCGASVDEQSL